VIARESWVLLLVTALGCGTPEPRVAPRKPPITDDNACARLCDDLASCGGAPGRCVATCEDDRAVLRPGFQASFVSCVEHELVPPACSTSPDVIGDPQARSEKISLCYSATLEVYANADGGKNFRRVLTASCKRRMRCGTVDGAPIDPAKEEACIAELTESLGGTVVVKVLAAARDEVVTSIDACVEERPCNESDPVLRCLLTGATTGAKKKEQGKPTP
jgi:hypothetical protein